MSKTSEPGPAALVVPAPGAAASIISAAERRRAIALGSSGSGRFNEDYEVPANPATRALLCYGVVGLR